MKLEKRSSGGEGDMPPVQEEKPAKSRTALLYTSYRRLPMRRLRLW